MNPLVRNPLARLKLSAVVFAVLWTGWMLWWSGSFERANVIMLTISATVAGYAWYRGMRWYFQRTGRFREINARPGSAAKTIGGGDDAD